MPTHQTSKPSRKENVPGVDRLQKYVGVRKVSYYYLYPNGASETVSSAPIGDRKAIAEAERIARRKVSDIQQGQVVAGSVAEMIDRFALQTAPIHYEDQSKDGIAVLLGYRFGWAIAHMTVAEECERLGGFYVGKKNYKCTAVEDVSQPKEGL